jgi:hypothetical protein
MSSDTPSTLPPLPGYDRDRALSLGAIMCLRRDRKRFFRMFPAERVISTLVTLGVAPNLMRLRRWATWCRLEWHTLDRYCEALENQVARSDVVPLRQAIPQAVPKTNGWTLRVFAAAIVALMIPVGVFWNVTAAVVAVSLILCAVASLIVHLRAELAARLTLHLKELEQFVIQANVLMASYDLPPIEFDAGYVQSGRRGLGSVESDRSFAAGALSRFIAEENYHLRLQLAQRLAELSWSPVPTDADGTIRIV